MTTALNGDSADFELIDKCPIKARARFVYKLVGACTPHQSADAARRAA